jgi:hypothetical protein
VGDAFLRAGGWLSTGRVLQAALAQAQAEILGRRRYARQPTPPGYRHGDADGTMQTAEGVFRLRQLYAQRHRGVARGAAQRAARVPGVPACRIDHARIG